MNSSFAIAFLGCMILIAVLSFLFKSFIKVVIVAIAIAVLFNLGFVWGADDLNNKLGLHKFFKDDISENIQDSYGDYAKKREENMIIDTNKIQQSVIETGESTLQKVQEYAPTRDEVLNELDKRLNQSQNTSSNE